MKNKGLIDIIYLDYGQLELFEKLELDLKKGERKVEVWAIQLV